MYMCSDNAIMIQALQFFPQHIGKISRDGGGKTWETRTASVALSTESTAQYHRARYRGARRESHHMTEGKRCVR